jgi:hypothetical protein
VAGNKGRLVGGKENEGVGDLIGLSHAAERHARDETGLSFGVAGKAIEHPGLDWPRCYRIDANAQARDLERRLEALLREIAVALAAREVGDDQDHG